jgi:hypothetical protein
MNHINSPPFVPRRSKDSEKGFQNLLAQSQEKNHDYKSTVVG